MLHAGEWYNGDVMKNIEYAMKTGGDPNVSDAYAINGLLGPSDACPTGNLIIFHHMHIYILSN